jgi:hypothetical protein
MKAASPTVLCPFINSPNVQPAANNIRRAHNQGLGTHEELLCLCVRNNDKIEQKYVITRQYLRETE